MPVLKHLLIKDIYSNSNCSCRSVILHTCAQNLPVDVKVTKLSYFRAAGKYKDMRTGPNHVFDMKVGKN